MVSELALGPPQTRGFVLLAARDFCQPVRPLSRMCCCSVTSLARPMRVVIVRAAAFDLVKAVPSFRLWVAPVWRSGAHMLLAGDGRVMDPHPADPGTSVVMAEAPAAGQISPAYRGSPVFGRFTIRPKNQSRLTGFLA